VSNSGVDPTGLVGAYGFEETTGTTVTDSSPAGNTGTINGATRTTTGKFGRALSFNGTTNWVTVGDATSLRFSTGFTLEAWVNPTATTGWRTVALKEQTGGLAWALYANTDTNRPSGHVTTTTEFDIRGTAQVPANAWTHLAVTYDGATLRLYVNGAQASSKAVTGTIATSTGALRIGGNNIWSEWFTGQIDEIRMYSRALSASEIPVDMNRPVIG